MKIITYSAVEKRKILAALFLCLKQIHEGQEVVARLYMVGSMLHLSEIKTDEHTFLRDYKGNMFNAVLHLCNLFIDSKIDSNQFATHYNYVVKTAIATYNTGT